MYRLVFLTGSHKGRRLAVQRGDVLIGRDPECHVPVQASSAAMRHAVLEARPAGHFIRLLGPGGLLAVNGVDVREEELRHGDEIAVGEDRFLFQVILSDQNRLKRRISKFHGLTFVAVAGILVIQLLILAGLFILWRVDPIHVPVVEELWDESETATSAAEDELLERLRARADTGQLVDERDEVDTVESDTFGVLPEWFVVPDFVFEFEPPLSDALDEGSAPDLFPTEEE